MIKLQKYYSLILPILIAIILVIIYAGILPSELTIANDGKDGGDFMSAILTHGIPHPTGYPTYLILARLFQLLPLSTAYFRGALVSFIPALTATSFLALLPFWMDQNKKVGFVKGLLTSLCLGAAPLFISQAVIVEVYSLESMFVTCFLIWGWISLQAHPGKKANLGLMGLSFLCGLSLGGHVTIVFLVPIFVLGLFFMNKHAWPKTSIVICILLFFSGGLIYCYLPWLARSYPPVNWGNPQSPGGLIWLVSGQLYKEFLLNLTLPQLWERIKALAALFLSNFGYLGLLTGIWGAFRPGKYSLYDYILIYVWGVYCFFSIFYGTNDSMVYLIPALMVFSVWIGLSLPGLWKEKYKQIPWGKIVVVLLIVSLLIKFPMTRAEVDPRQDQSAKLFAEGYLKSVPQDAILITSADDDTFPLWYYHYGLHWRPDLKIITLGLYEFDWYQDTLQRTYPDLKLAVSGNKNYDKVWIEQLSSMNNHAVVCRSWPLESKVYEVKQNVI